MAGSHLPVIEFRNTGNQPELYVDGHLMRGVTSVTVSHDVHDLTRVSIELVTDQLLAPANVAAPVADPEVLFQREVLAELRGEDGELQAFPPQLVKMTCDHTEHRDSVVSVGWADSWWPACTRRVSDRPPRPPKPPKDREVG
jgi:hypothetical protein